MARIEIGRVVKAGDNYRIQVILTQTQMGNNGNEKIPLGEAFISVPLAMEMEDIRRRIIDIANQLMKAHKEALDKKREIERLSFPEIE